MHLSINQESLSLSFKYIPQENKDAISAIHAVELSPAVQKILSKLLMS